MPRQIALSGLFFVVVTFLAAYQNCSEFNLTGDSGEAAGISSSASLPAPTPVGDASSQPDGSCQIGSLKVANGASTTMYLTSAATAARGCAKEVRACVQGKLSGSAAFVSCTPEPADGIELIADVGAKTGFRETDACSKLTDQPGSGDCKTFVEHDVANPFFPKAEKPQWTLQQWGSKSSAPSGLGVPYGDGRSWENTDKRFAIFPSGIFEMGVSGVDDFAGVYRQTSNRPGWPSLYLGYNITPPVAQPLGSGPVSTMKNLNFNFDVRLVNENRFQQAGYDPNKNSIIFVLYITIQQLNPKAPGYGKYVWLGVPVYNDLEQSPGAYINSDDFGDGLGTHMLIYSVAYSKFASTSVHSAQWVHLTRDLLPDARAALSLAMQQHLLDDTDLNNYYVSGMVVGFEVTGLNRTWMQFKTPSLKVKH